MYRETRNPGEGKYDIPAIGQAQFEQADFIGFNYAKSEKHPQNKAVHFFLDDYQFNRVWTYPDRYIEMLRRFRYVLSPDFSLYTDFPMAMQIYNHYRKHWIARYWQESGIKVIPTICWSSSESFEWCFDGEPTQSVVAISSLGTQNSKEKENILGGIRGNDKKTGSGADHILWPGTGGM